MDPRLPSPKTTDPSLQSGSYARGVISSPSRYDSPSPLPADLDALTSDDLVKQMRDPVAATPAERAAAVAAAAGAAPVDRFNAVYVIMTLLGAGLLFPYNTLVSAADYLKAEYPTSNLLFWIPLVMNISSPPIQVFMVRYGSRFSFVRRAVIWFTLETALIVALPLLINGLNSGTSLYITFASLFVFGFATSIMTSTTYAWASMFPPVYTQAVMGGNGVAGVVASVCRIITKGSFPDTDDGNRRGAFVFFMLSALTTVRERIFVRASRPLPCALWRLIPLRFSVAVCSCFARSVSW